MCVIAPPGRYDGRGDVEGEVLGPRSPRRWPHDAGAAAKTSSPWIGHAVLLQRGDHPRHEIVGDVGVHQQRLGGVADAGALGLRVDDDRERLVEVGGPDGTYVVSYRVVSADGHPVRGGSVFGVGEGAVDSGLLGRVASDSNDRTWEVIGAIGRGLAYAGVLVAAGGMAFLVLVHRGGAERDARADGPGRGRRGCARRAGCASVQAALGTGQGAGSLFDEGVFARWPRTASASVCCWPSLGLVVATPRSPARPSLAAGGRSGGRRLVRDQRAHPRRVDRRVWRPPPTSPTSGSWPCGAGGSCCSGAFRARRAEADRTDTSSGRTVLHPRHRGDRARRGDRRRARLARGAAPSTPSRARATASCSWPRCPGRRGRRPRRLQPLPAGARPHARARRRRAQQLWTTLGLEVVTARGRPGHHLGARRGDARPDRSRPRRRGAHRRAR